MADDLLRCCSVTSRGAIPALGRVRENANGGDKAMKKIAGLMFLLTGVAGLAVSAPLIVPEISVSSAGSALAMLTGAMLVIRGRKK